jgi:hypothetical protein
MEMVNGWSAGGVCFPMLSRVPLGLVLKRLRRNGKGKREIEIEKDR